MDSYGGFNLGDVVCHGKRRSLQDHPLEGKVVHITSKSVTVLWETGEREGWKFEKFHPRPASSLLVKAR